MNFLKKPISERSSRLLFLSLAVITAVLYDLLVFNHNNGLGFAFFVVFITTSFVILTFATNNLKVRWPLFLLIPIGVLTIDVLVFNNELVTGLVPKFVYLLLLFFTILLTLRINGKPFSFRNIPIVNSVDQPFGKWSLVFKDLFRSKESVRSELYKKIAYGLVASIPLLLVFGVLFGSADAVFSNLISRIFDIKINFDEVLIWRILRTFATALLMAGILYVIISEEHTLLEKIRNPRRIDPVIIGIVFGLINTMFLVFVVIQLKYLFGSAEYVLQNGLTYAEYARRGFFELVWVIIISGLLLVVSYRSLNHHGRSIAVQALKLILVAQVLFIAFSALTRMNVYQEAYGFTTLRLYVEWFIYFAVVGFIFLSFAIIRNYKFQKFFYGVLISGITAFTLVASLNVDGIIAKKNINRSLYDGKPLDIHYLLSLSPDAYAEMFDMADNRIKFKEGTDKTVIEILLEKKKIFMTEKSWKDFNVNRSSALENIKKLIELMSNK